MTPTFPALRRAGSGSCPGRPTRARPRNLAARPPASARPCKVSRKYRRRISSADPFLPLRGCLFDDSPRSPARPGSFAAASGGGSAFPASHPAPLIRSRNAAAAPRSKAPFRSFRCSHADRKARFRNRVSTSSPSNPTYSASWNAGSPAPSHGYPRFHGKIMGTVRPQSAVTQGRRASWAVLERWRRSRSRAKASPARTKIQVAEGAKQQQDQQRERPGEVPEFVRRVGHPMEADRGRRRNWASHPPQRIFRTEPSRIQNSQRGM